MDLPADHIDATDDELVAEPRLLPFWTTFILLYLVGAALLVWRLWNRPDFAYNWESYTLRGLIDFVRQPTWNVARLNEGLMTESGTSAVVVGPAWVGFKILGPTFLGLRLPIALISAFTVPLTWVLGRRLSSDAIGLTAALLVATSQVFLLYGRTGTNAGMSLTVGLIAYLVLWQCVRRGDVPWRGWLIALQAVLIVSSYFYGVIRFLWPIALVLFAIELLLRSDERRRFLTSLGVTAVVLPIAVMLLLPGPLRTPGEAMERYYNGRGENIFAINDRSQYLSFLRIEDPIEREELADASNAELARRLIEQNARDLARLLTDQETRPAITDYWNPHGRLYPALLVPLFLIGTAMLLRRFPRSARARFVFVLFWGYSLPILLTSNVHIGRLIFIVPVLSIIVALPIAPVVRWLLRRQPRDYRPRIERWAGLAVGAVIVLIGAVPSLSDWSVEFPRARMDIVAEQIVELTREPPTGQLVYVFGDSGAYPIESLRIAELEISLHNYLRFVDLREGVERGTGPIPLLYGAMLERIDDPDSLPGYCTNHYLVEPGLEERFLEMTGPVARATCGGPLRYSILVH